MYETNFPDTLEVKDLKKLCEPHALVADVYIARKVSKLGRKFTFFRFLQVKDQKLLLEDLNRIWIGNFHVYATIARFERKHVRKIENGKDATKIPRVLNHELGSSKRTNTGESNGKKLCFNG